MSDYLPDISNIPDSETKRKVKNLAEEFEIILEQLGTANLMGEKLGAIHSQANKVYWEMNAQVGKLFEQERNKSSENWKYYLSLIFSGSALIISLLALFK